MRIFCPVCGRTRQFNTDLIGLTPKICACCLFDLAQNIGQDRKTAGRWGTPHRLRPHGLTYVCN